ncbi:MAG: hypothetical protein WAM82_26115 [Thermoanaerobaculia bacterium]
MESIVGGVGRLAATSVHSVYDLHITVNHLREVVVRVRIVTAREEGSKNLRT